MITFNLREVVNEVRSHVETACGEMASDMVSPSSGFLDNTWAKRIKAAKRKGVRDIQGWLADELFNDPATVADLMGDRIYDATRGSEKWTEEVYAELAKNPNFKKAVDILRKI